jgi:hypothetical protein
LTDDRVGTLAAYVGGLIVARSLRAVLHLRAAGRVPPKGWDSKLLRKIDSLAFDLEEREDWKKDAKVGWTGPVVMSFTKLARALNADSDADAETPGAEA